MLETMMKNYCLKNSTKKVKYINMLKSPFHKFNLYENIVPFGSVQTLLTDDEQLDDEPYEDILEESSKKTRKDMLQYAISRHKVISFYYVGDKDLYKGFRVVEPYVVGYGKRGQLFLRAYQTSKTSRSEHQPYWRLFNVQKIKNIAFFNKEFTKPRTGFNKTSDIHIPKIIEIANFSKRKKSK